MIIVDEHNRVEMDKWRAGLSDDFKWALCGFLLQATPWDVVAAIVAAAFEAEELTAIVEILQAALSGGNCGEELRDTLATLGKRAALISGPGGPQ